MMHNSKETDYFCGGRGGKELEENARPAYMELANKAAMVEPSVYAKFMRPDFTKKVNHEIGHATQGTLIGTPATRPHPAQPRTPH